MKVTAMNKIHSRSAGFSLLEVMIAVVVLAFGLISLAALQGRLFQSGAESKARAAATAIAQQTLEDARTFAFVTPPTGYEGPTYVNLDSSATPSIFAAGGVEFTVERTVTRYRYVDTDPTDTTPGQFVADPDTTNGTGNYSGGVPEFKQVDISVGWTGSDGEDKTVSLTDSIAAVAPADAAMLRLPSSESMAGPQVWIEPPNKDSPQVVPIAIGDDQSAASSNPKPEQFVKSDSAVTRFSVMTFTGSDSTEVLLNRKVDVSVATCVCQADGTSSAINPTYQSTVWNGMQQAYVEPQALPVGTPIGSAVVANADSEIEPTCTVCCRDHHENANRNPRPDPYRALTGDEADGNEHYGYAKGSNLGEYIVDDLVPAAQAGGTYVDSCQIIRVGGRLRLATDAMQNNLLAASLNDAGTGYRIANFANRYAGYVTDTITNGMASLPTGYVSPTARFPGPTTTLQTAYSDIVDPDPIPLTTAGEKKTLVAFGLYIDYLSPETRKAYQCALDNDTSSTCAGLGAMDPLQVLPFYAVNVANLGSWSSSKTEVATVAGAMYNKGVLVSDGGLVTAQSEASVEAFPVSIEINNSNSGLAGTNPVDPDDEADSSFVQAAQNFTKSDGTSGGGTARTLSVVVGTSTTLALKTIIESTTADGVACVYSSKNKTATCSYTAPDSSLTLVFSNYVDVNNKGVVTADRKICIASDSRITGVFVSGNGTANETTTVTISGPLTQDYTLSIDVIAEGSTCNSASPSLTP